MSPEQISGFFHSEMWELMSRCFSDRREQARDDIERTRDDDLCGTARHKAISGFIQNEILHESFKTKLLEFNEQRKKT